MAQGNVTKCRGLITQFNPLSVAEGALVQADNCAIRREDVIENRRGYAVYAELNDPGSQLMRYRSRTLVNQSTLISYDDGAGIFKDYAGSYTPPTGRKMRFQDANSNLYVTTDDGVMVLMDVTAPLTTTGNITISSNQLTSLAAVTDVAVGKIISGAGIPTGTYVASISGSTVTMSANATTSTTGVTVTFTSTARPAGAPRALGPSAVLTGSTGFLSTNENCAYRIVIKRIDQNNNTLVGYPSERLWVSNASGSSKNVQLTCYLSSDVRANDIIQVYRTETATGAAADTAGDEEGLVYQITLTQAQIIATSVVFIDSVDDALIGETIYTAPSQEGIAQANAQPPLAKDLAFFKGSQFYANTQTRQQLFFSLISVAPLGLATTGDLTSGNNQLINLADTTNIAAGMKITGTGVAIGATVLSIVGTTVTMSANATGSGTAVAVKFVTNRTLTLSGTTYTFADTSSPTTGVIGVSLTGVAAFDIDATARNITQAVNLFPTNTTVLAFYASSADDLPGQVLIEERAIGGAPFTIAVSNASISGAFFPNPPVSPLTTPGSTSSNNVQGNALYFSKFQEPEAVPFGNYFLIGPSNTDILRIAALRDSIIIIKSEGVYRLTGDDAQSFNVTPLDLTVFCKALETVDVLANLVYMLTNQGVVAVGDTGVQVVSREIEPNLLPLLTYPNLSTYTFGVSYESERTYLLSTINSAADTAPVQIYTYNIFTRAWTRWTFAFTTAIVETTTDKLFFCKSGDVDLYRERKTFTKDDYSDPELVIEILSISGADVTFTVAGADPQAGWVIVQGQTELKIETLAINGSDWVGTMQYAPPAEWVPGAALIYPGIDMQIEWEAWTGGQPGFMKSAQEFKVLTDTIPGNDSITSLTCTFRTDLDRNQSEQIINSNSEGWGAPWGSFPWGGVAETYGYPTYLPQRQTYFRVLQPGVIHANAKEKISIDGFSVTFEMISQRVAR